VVAAIKESCGFIRCAERDSLVFFHFSEVITTEEDIVINTEVEFTVTQVFIGMFTCQFDKDSNVFLLYLTILARSITA